MNRTIFYEKHKALGARIVPFAGFEMPVEYTGVNEEHCIVREKVGLFDVSHMGEFWVKGPKALDLLQKVTSNDVSKLTVGKAQYSCFPNGKGGIVDDLIVYKYSDDKYFLVVNASNIDKDWEWLNKNNTMGAETENASGKISQLAIQGPNALPLLQKLTDIDLKLISYYSFKVGAIAGAKDVIISATGYTGSGGFELYFYNSDGEVIFDNIMKAGDEFGLKPVGLAARDTLRLEMGYALYGNDIDDTISPIEAGLGWITKFVDGKDFIDKEVLLKQKNNGTSRKLVGFEMLEKAIPRHGYDITDATGNKIGEVTSGTMSPSLKKGIGMGYVPVSLSLVGSEIFINIRNKNMKAKVVNLPFYKK
jgi:aminomethyltransferase